MIPYGKQDISQADIDAVVDVLKSEYLTQGPTVPRFEKNLAEYCNVNYSVAVNSATSALHVACLALGLGKGDWLWTSPNTFVASANCGLYCGADVDFVDIDPLTYNMCPIELEKKLILAEKENRLPKVVIPVHFAGQSCNMKEIRRLGDRYGFKVIEDASHAIGGKYLGRPVGGCEYSDITIFSFHPVKIITTAEGGVATTNDELLYKKMLLLRSHGITRDPNEMIGSSEGGWFYQQVDLGFNYRMTEMQAALGLSQLSRLDAFVRQRHQLASRYNDMLVNVPVLLPFQSSWAFSAYHLYPILLKTDQLSRDRAEIFDELRNKGIGVNVHYIPVHAQPYYRSRGFSYGDFPVSESYYSREISIPIFNSMTVSQQNDVVRALSEVIK